MADLIAFPDVEAALIELLDDIADSAATTPSNLQETLPFVRVTRFGGGDDFITDTVHVDVDSFGATRAQAFEIAELVRQRMIGFPHRLSAAVLDTVRTDTGPHEVDWGDPNVRRFTAAYTVTARRFF